MAITAKPTPRQLEYQDWEFGIFLHFGIRTFYEGHRDWDGKPMSPRLMWEFPRAAMNVELKRGRAVPVMFPFG